MFNSIRGTITEKLPSSVYILTGGIEWDITMPASDIGALPDIGSDCKIWTYLCHREDAMLVFGFENKDRRRAFYELLKVDGIGPKAAIKILGGISQGELESALERGDVARLEAVPGLGKKTAQKMILALKGKIVRASDKSSVSPFNELADALVEMGYEKRASIAALEKASNEISDDTADRESATFRRAIMLLSG
jgi:Holliday junction DNA helicase RuvA